MGAIGFIQSQNGYPADRHYPRPAKYVAWRSEAKMERSKHKQKKHPKDVFFGLWFMYST
jgi:hypothetical protein